MKEGLNQKFHDNGRTKEEFIVINGVIQGYYRKWNDKGEIIYECKYVDGKKIGEIILSDRLHYIQYVYDKENTEDIRKIIRSML